MNIRVLQMNIEQRFGRDDALLYGYGGRARGPDLRMHKVRLEL